MTIKVLKPKPGNAFLRPEIGYKPLAPDGEPIEMTAYYRKALTVGDVVEVEEPEATPVEIPRVEAKTSTAATGFTSGETAAEGAA